MLLNLVSFSIPLLSFWIRFPLLIYFPENISIRII